MQAPPARGLTAHASRPPRAPARRTLTNNLVVGVSDGFERRLELVGTGYRASTTATELTLNLGYSKPRILTIPKGIKVAVRLGARAGHAGVRLYEQKQLWERGGAAQQRGSSRGGRRVAGPPAQASKAGGACSHRRRHRLLTCLGPGGTQLTQGRSCCISGQSPATG
jgi:hypothetical protein